MSAMLRSRQFWISFVVTLAVCAGVLVVVRGQSNAASSQRRPTRTASASVAAVETSTGQTVSSTPRPATASTTGASTSTSTTTSAATWVDPVALRASGRRIAAASGAAVGVAVRPLGPGPSLTDGTLQVAAAWSTMKVPVILARYRLAESRHESTGDLVARVTAAITESDNAAVQSLFNDIAARLGGVVPASAYVQEGLRAAGDTDTVVNTVQPAGGFSTFGQTQWSLTDGLRFFRALADGCLAPQDGVQEILTLMGEITPSQRWGLGQARFAGASVQFKGGWGPDPSGRYVVRQFGVVRATGGHGFVVGMIDKPADGTFASGISVLDQLADAVARSVRPATAPTSVSCAT